MRFLLWLLRSLRGEYVQCMAELEVQRGLCWAYCQRGVGHPGKCRTNDGKRFRSPNTLQSTKEKP